MVPGIREFKEMVGRGRLYKWPEPDPRVPTRSELRRARNALEFGRLYGYSEDDIAHFYRARRLIFQDKCWRHAYDDWVRDLTRWRL